MKILSTLAMATTLLLLSACGGASPKVVPATPVTKAVPTAQSQKELHSNIVLLAKYKKYIILKDDGKSYLRIQYKRMKTDRKTKETTLRSSITYDVKNSTNNYTFSYIDSKNLGYNDVNISSTYIRYINMFDSTLKRMYKDPNYIERMKNVVAGKNPDGSEKIAK